jgi:phosphate/sulfate permease
LGRLATDQQFERERRRQDLLDQRWRRWRSMLVTTGALVGFATGLIPVEKAMAVLLGTIGA